MVQALAMSDEDVTLVIGSLRLGRFFPGRLAAAKFKRIFPSSGVVGFDEGEVVIKQGERSDDVYVVLSGSVEILRSLGSSGGSLASLGVGEIFGEMAVLTGGVRTATAAASGDCRLFRLCAADLKSLMPVNPELSAHLSSLVRTRSGR